MSYKNGSIIGVDNTPTLSVASGIWDLNAVRDFEDEEVWPIAAINTTIALSDILAWYDIDEGSGTSLTDETGNGHTGTITDATWQVGGGPTNNPDGLDFNGSSAWVDFNTDHNVADATLMVWAEFDDVTAAQGIINNGSAGADYGLDIGVSTSGKARIIATIGGGGRQAESSVLSNSTLYHICGVVRSSTSSDLVRLTIDGSDDGSDSADWGAISHDTDDAILGRRAETSATRFFNGRIYGAAFFSTDLTQAQCAELYNGGAGGKFRDFNFA